MAGGDRTGAIDALADSARTSRPRRTVPLWHVQGGEHADGFHPVHEALPLLLEGLDLVPEVCQVFLVDEHLAPVLDQHIPCPDGEIAQERAAEKRSAATRKLRPLAVRAIEPLERLLVPRLDVEVPHDCYHLVLQVRPDRAAESGVQQYTQRLTTRRGGVAARWR